MLGFQVHRAAADLVARSAGASRAVNGASADGGPGGREAPPPPWPPSLAPWGGRGIRRVLWLSGGIVVDGAPRLPQRTPTARPRVCPCSSPTTTGPASGCLPTPACCPWAPAPVHPRAPGNGGLGGGAGDAALYPWVVGFLSVT